MYIFVEMQTSEDHSVTAIPPINTQTDWHEAEATFHQLCAAAAVSPVPLHTVLMLDEYGNTIRAEHYEHEV